MKTPPKSLYSKMTPRIIPRLLPTVGSPTAASLVAVPVEPPPIASNAQSVKPKVEIATIEVYLEVATKPERGGLGVVFALDMRKRGGRAISVALYRERALVARSLETADHPLLRFLASLLLIEFFARSRHVAEITTIASALEKCIGGSLRFF